MHAEDQIRLKHMIEACEAALRFASGRPQSDLDADQMLLFAVVRAVEIVGEAASKVTEATRVDLSEIPWKSIIGMRNRLVHAYFEIDTDIVWVAITVEIPLLLSRLKTLDLSE